MVLKKTRKTKTTVPEDAPVMVRVEGISKHYGRLRALDQVSFEIRKGEVIGFLGPNGAGKTTTVRILAGFFPPTEGRVWVDGQQLFKNPQGVKAHIGYLPETISLYSDMRVWEYLSFVAKIKKVPWKGRKEHLEEVLASCNLWDVRKRLIGRLSKGFRQRVGLAQALVGNPDVLILDEPTNGLDPKQIYEIRTLLRELGKNRTLLLSSHILPEVSMVCDRVLIMNKGKIVASGTTDELEAGLKKRQEIYVTIGDVELKDEAIKILTDITGVEKVQVITEKKDHVSLTVSADKGQDLRADISRLFVINKIPLLEIRSGRLSLEEIFMKIVVQEDAPENLL